MKISIIAALGQNNVIGKDNKLPWHLPADFKRFKQLTMGKPIILGSRTFESIGKPLPGRINIILTRNNCSRRPDVLFASSLEEAVALSQNHEELMICGGASVYKQFLPLATKMYLTLIHQAFQGNVFFPEYNKEEWQEVERIDNEADDDNPYPYSFVVLTKK